MKKALVVGINNYPKPAELTGCINDATELTKLLKTHGDGSPNFDVVLETDVKTKSELKTLISDLFKGTNDIALLYFSGHGFMSEVGGYLVTPDYKHNDEGISMYDILMLANKSQTKDKIIILDCCYSGGFGSPEVTGQAALLNDGISILTASRKDEPSIELKNGHGVFTNLLLNALRGGAADLRGHITPGGIYSHIDQALGPWDQRPVFKTNVTRFTSLREVDPQVPAETIRKITEYFSTPEQNFNLDPSYEDTNSKTVKHEVIKPYANDENIAVFKNLQKLQSVGLVVPIDADYMYFAAMKSKSCKLTPLGHHFWRLVKDERF